MNILEDVNLKLLNELQTSGSTIAIKNLQMVQLQKSILAIGIFSLFDSMLQNELGCQNGFRDAKKKLLKKEKIELHNRFDEFICAINVLKHGRGKSYDALVLKYQSLPFRIKIPQ